MRLARTRRALGPLAPVAVAWYRRGQAWLASRTRPAIVVVATDGRHDGEAAALATELDDATGFWLTSADDVSGYGSLGWFVVRLEAEAWTDDVVDARIGSVADALVLRRVVDLRG